MPDAIDRGPRDNARPGLPTNLSTRLFQICRALPSLLQRCHRTLITIPPDGFRDARVPEAGSEGTEYGIAHRRTVSHGYPTVRQAAVAVSAARAPELAHPCRCTTRDDPWFDSPCHPRTPAQPRRALFDPPGCLMGEDRSRLSRHDWAQRGCIASAVARVTALQQAVVLHCPPDRRASPSTVWNRNAIDRLQSRRHGALHGNQS